MRTHGVESCAGQEACRECEDYRAATTRHRHPLSIMIYGFEHMFKRDWGHEFESGIKEAT